MWPTFTVFAQWKASKSRDEKQRHQQEWLGPGETDRGSRIDSPIPSSKAHPPRFAAYQWSHCGIAGIEAGRDQDLKMKSCAAALITEECHYCMLEREEECLLLEPQFASVLGAWLFAACCWHPATSSLYGFDVHPTSYFIHTQMAPTPLCLHTPILT